MDSDLQDPPELIPESWSRDGRKASTSFTLGERRGRVSPPSSVPAPLPSIVSFGLSLPSPFLLIRATSDYFPVVPPTPSVHFANDGGFCGGFVAWTGFRQTSVLYDRPSRAVGESKYSLGAMVRLAMTATFSFSSFPITLVGLAGAAVCAGSLLALGLGVAVGTAALFFSRRGPARGALDTGPVSHPDRRGSKEKAPLCDSGGGERSVEPGQRRIGDEVAAVASPPEGDESESDESGGPHARSPASRQRLQTDTGGHSNQRPHEQDLLEVFEKPARKNSQSGEKQESHSVSREHAES